MKNWPATLCLFFTWAALAESKPLTLYTESFPPYNFEEHNQPTGINTEIVETLCKHAKLKCVIQVLPWRRAMSKTLEQPYSGIFSTSRTTQREAQFQWVGPLVSGQSCLYRLSERTDIELTSSRLLTNYTIGVSRGDVYQAVLTDLQLVEGHHFLTYSGKFEELNMFKRGKHDLLIGSSMTLATQLQKVALSPEQVIPVLELNHPALGGNYLALNKSAPASVVSALQRALDTMKENGQIAPIVEKFVSANKYPHVQTSPTVDRCFYGTAVY